MEYIVSRDSGLESARRVQQPLWYSLWEVRLQPYRELVKGDVLYWYDTTTRRVLWKSGVRWVDRFSYSGKKEVARRLHLGADELSEKYYLEAPGKGYCLAWRVAGVRRVNHPKPTGATFPRQGWLPVDVDIARKWLRKGLSEEVSLDDLASTRASLWKKLADLNYEMEDLSPERVKKIVSQTIRRDTKLVRTLKELCDHRCQFPRCGARIQKKSGSFYVEVAHIEAVGRGGQSVLGNLVVLCPNHHKEFDHGARRISLQTLKVVKGTLNGKQFTIRLPEKSTGAK